MVLLHVRPVLLAHIHLLLGFLVLVHCVGPEHTVPLQALRQALSACNAALGRTPPRSVLLCVRPVLLAPIPLLLGRVCAHYVVLVRMARLWAAHRLLLRALHAVLGHIVLVLVR